MPHFTETTDAADIHSLTYQGCQLSYHVRGDGPPVIFIQGTGLHGDGWLPQIRELADTYQCLWFDNRGMGRSQPVGAAVSVEQMAADALALIDAQGWQSAHIVGHSLGGPIALQLALTARERVRSLALLCSFARGRDALSLSFKALLVASRTRLGTPRQRRHAFLELVMSHDTLATLDRNARDALAEELVPLFGHDLAEQPAVVSAQMAAMRAYDATPRLGTLAGIPTLVMSGSDDLIARPAYGRALAASIPGARYVEIAGGTHGVVIQRAGEINTLLREHFAAADTRLQQA